MQSQENIQTVDTVKHFYLKKNLSFVNNAFFGTSYFEKNES